MRRLLPQKITKDSIINLVHTSSAVYPKDASFFTHSVQRLKKDYPRTTVFEVKHSSLDPRYLAASENERLRRFKLAIKNVDWLLPVYGGTGCADIVRYLHKEELANIRKNRPVVNGFSDTTFLINYLWFKIRLLGFHYTNASGLFWQDNHKDFFDIIQGKKNIIQYRRSSYEWLNPNQGPDKPIKGIAIGGNLETFRDLLDICQIQPRSWEDYILFLEDINLDMEDLHRIIISLDQKGVFMHVKAVVVGVMNEKLFRKNWLQLNRTYTNTKMADHMFEYLVSDVIEERTEDRDPLYILKVDNFGHNIKNQMIIPIGGKTTIYPDGTIEFKGPFVD